MKKACIAILLILLFTACSREKPQLMKLAVSEGVQLTGVTVCKTGRIFVNFPRWRRIPYSVAEIMPDGSFVPYPNEVWNSWKTGEPAGKKFVCIQSVVIDDDNYLWVLDPASPGFKGVIAEGAKLVKFDFKTNEAVRIINFDQSIAPEKSYLNDLRIDTDRKKIYITDSGLGALVIVDLETGKSRRVLDDHPSTAAEDVILSINGQDLIHTDGRKPQIHSDGIALDTDNGYLYYHALTGYHLYRIKTEYLNDFDLPENELATHVEDLGKTPAPDGMLLDYRDNLFMADLENNAIVYRKPTGEMVTFLEDDRLQWVDTFSMDRFGYIYFTCSHIHQTGWFKKGAEVKDMSFEVYKADIAILD